MDMDEYELEREASAPIDMLEHYFSALGWAYERNGEDEIVSSFQGSWTQYELRGDLARRGPGPPVPRASRHPRRAPTSAPRPTRRSA